jgi:L-cystine transport system ATP-binding protein
VKTGEVVVILGPSGSGKTTLLRSINFLENADKGTITIGNTTVDAHKATKKEILEVRRKTAMVFQLYNLFKNKTALQNVSEGLITVQKMKKDEAEVKAKEFLDKVGLSEKYNSYASQLSGGQQQRVAIARALALNPEVILFDEPTSALDPELVGEVLNVMEKVARSGMTMVVVTHELNFAYSIATKVIFMEEGVVVEEGTPKELFLSPKQERTAQFLKKIAPEPSYNI